MTAEITGQPWPPTPGPRSNSQPPSPTSAIGAAATGSAATGAANSLDSRHYERLLTISAALAGAPTLDNFAQTLLAAGLEFSAAARGFLVLDLNGAWSVVAGAQRSPQEFQSFAATPLAAAHEEHKLQVAPVLQAIRSRRTQFLAHAQNQIQCAPLFYNGQVSAILYLEKHKDPFSETAVHLIARTAQQAAPRLHSLQEMDRLAELVQLRREMTEALRASEERFRSIFNSSPVMIFLTDESGRLMMVNDYWLQTLGYNRVEAVGRHIGDFCAPAGRQILAQQFQPMPGHQYENLPLQFVRRNGAPIDALVSGVILHSEIEGVRQSLSFAIDMTAHRQAEQELDRYRRRLEELVRERTHELSAANRQLEQDILRRKAAEAQLLRSQQFLQATIDAPSEKLAILDAQGAIIALNSSWRAESPKAGPGTPTYWHGYQVGADYLTALQGAAPSSRNADIADRNFHISQPPNREESPAGPSIVDADIVRAVEKGLTALRTGSQQFFQVAYQVHMPPSVRVSADAGQEQQNTSTSRNENGESDPWVNLRAIRFQSGGEIYIAVAHDDITDRKQAEQALLEAAAVNERHRLARELHDSVTQTLYSMALFVDATRLALDAGQVERASNNMAELRAMSRGAMENMRALIFELHPPELAEIGLVGALREYLKNYQHRTQIGVDFAISGEERAFPVRAESELYRVAQEALNNAFKHARADHIAVDLRYHTQGLDLTICDNGQGFQVDLAHLSGGMGLRGMHERIRSIGGRIEVESNPGRGAIVRVRMETTPEPSAPRSGVAEETGENAG